MKKVLVFSHEFPPMQGGEGTYSYELANGLNKLGYDVYVLAGTMPVANMSTAVIDNELASKNIKIERYNWVKRNRLWFLTWSLTFGKYLQRHGPFDHIFFSNFTSCVVGHRSQIEKLPSYSIAIHGDDMDYYFTNNKWKARVLVNKRRIRKFFYSANKIICVSHYTKRKLNRLIKFNIEPDVVHHGIEPLLMSEDRLDQEVAKRKFREKYNISSSATVLAYVARLVPKKGQDKLIDVLSNDIELARRTHTIFVGGGPSYDYLNGLAKKNGLTDCVSFTREVPRYQVIDIVSHSDVLVFLSDHPLETFGIVILEAMALKKPVIVLNHGGMIESVQNLLNGFIVEKDEDDIKAKILSLVNDVPLRLKMGEEGYKLIMSKFNNMEMAQQTVKGLPSLCVES